MLLLSALYGKNDVENDAESNQKISCENPSFQITCGRTQYRHSSPDREFHNVNCRFCGAIHDVDWANISVLSQVIRNVNERKTVQTNMISFVSHGDKTLQRLIGMSGEQEYHICLYRFSFSLHIKSRLVKENRNYYNI